jgi:hypothetical protein
MLSLLRKGKAKIPSFGRNNIFNLHISWEYQMKTLAFAFQTLFIQ